MGSAGGNANYANHFSHSHHIIYVMRHQQSAHFFGETSWNNLVSWGATVQCSIYKVGLGSSPSFSHFYHDSEKTRFLIYFERKIYVSRYIIAIITVKCFLKVASLPCYFNFLWRHMVAMFVVGGRRGHHYSDAQLLISLPGIKTGIRAAIAWCHISSTVTNLN